MKIMMDEEAQRAFTMVADAALKSGGVQILQPVNTLMAAAKTIKPDTGKPEPEKDDSDG